MIEKQKMKLNRELTKDAVNFIDDNLLHNLINNTKENPAVYRKVFEKSRNKQASPTKRL